MEAKIQCNNLLKKLFSRMEHFSPPTAEPIRQFDKNKLFVFLENQELLSFTNEDTLQTAKSLIYEYNKAVISIKKLDLHNAYTCILEIDKTAEETLSGEIYMLVKQRGVSAKALFYFYKEQLEAARCLTLEGIEISNNLVIRGCFTAIYRCLEQNFNLAKIYIEDGEEEKGMELYGNLLTYQINGKAEGLEGSIFLEDSYWHKYACLREASAFESFKQMCSYLIKFSSANIYKEHLLFKYLFGKATQLEENNAIRQVLFKWLSLKESFFRCEYEAFISETIKFMEEPLHSEFDILKLSLCQNVSFLLQQSSLYKKKVLSAQLVGFISKKLHVSTKYKALVSVGGS